MIDSRLPHMYTFLTLRSVCPSVTNLSIVTISIGAMKHADGLLGGPVLVWYHL
jgi:hypothetical protein